MGTAGTWCRIYDEGDIGAIVREGTVLYSNPFDFDHLFARSDIPVGLNGCGKNVPLSSTKEEPENVCSTASSPQASEYQKYPPRSPKRELDNSSPKEIEIKSEANDQMSPSKMCPSPRLPAIKRRKSQQKSIVCIPMVEGSWNKQGGAGVASDLWSWRKYGQKPIKGSPYPRGYYRCSSSKGCPARKQVERSRTDPTMLLITYTADHNHASPAHRRALARSSGHNSFSSHDKKENSFSLQQPLSLSVPDAAIATDHDHDHNHNDLSPPNKSAQHEDNYLSQCVDNSLFDDDQQFLSPNNHIFHDDLFQSFGDFSSLFRSDLTNRSDEEDDCTMVDPFNLFDWSFSTTNEWPNS